MKFLLLLLVACGAAQTRAKPTTGAITGLVRDKKSMEPLENAELDLSGHKTASDKAGMYLFDHLKPGTYTLHAKYAGKPITIKNIEVVRGEASYVDVSFLLGEVATDEIVDWSVSREAEIIHFASSPPRIEGTVADATTHRRVAGAVVTATNDVDTLQVITDDSGRYRFDNVVPGTYAVSAYYSIGGRGQIEVRRTDVTVQANEGVLVPLWIELTK